MRWHEYELLTDSAGWRARQKFRSRVVSAGYCSAVYNIAVTAANRRQTAARINTTSVDNVTTDLSNPLYTVDTSILTLFRPCWEAHSARAVDP